MSTLLIQGKINSEGIFELPCLSPIWYGDPVLKYSERDRSWWRLVDEHQAKKFFFSRCLWLYSAYFSSNHGHPKFFSRSLLDLNPILFERVHVFEEKNPLGKSRAPRALLPSLLFHMQRQNFSSKSTSCTT